MTHATHPSLLPAGLRFAARGREYHRASGDQTARLYTELRGILDRLAVEPEVRFFLDGTRNLGHQASTIALLGRLIECAEYRGRMVIVYADYRNSYLGRTAEKLALLITGVDPSQLDRAELALTGGGKIMFLPFERRGELSEKVGFGFTGGADDMTVNYARELNVNYFCRIQPYRWDDGPERKDDPYYESSRIECRDGRCLYLVDAWPEYASLLVHPPAAPGTGVGDGVWRWYAASQQFDPALRTRVRGAYALHRALARRNDLWLWPQYGLHHFHDAAPDVVLNALLAACRLQSLVSGTLLQVSFTPEDELPTAHRWLHALADDLHSGDRCFPRLREAFGKSLATAGIDSVENHADLAARLEELVAELAPWLDRGGRLRVLHGYDPERGEYRDLSRMIEESLRDAGEHDVFWIGLGTQPPEIFHDLFRRASFPGILEGQASANYLLGNAVPFLQIIREEQVFANGYPPVSEGTATRVPAELNALAVQLRDRRLRGAARRREHAEVVDALLPVDWLWSKRSDIKKYFRRVAMQWGGETRDKFLLGLLALGIVVEGGGEE